MSDAAVRRALYAEKVKALTANLRTVAQNVTEALTKEGEPMDIVPKSLKCKKCGCLVAYDDEQIRLCIETCPSRKTTDLPSVCGIWHSDQYVKNTLLGPVKKDVGVLLRSPMLRQPGATDYSAITVERKPVVETKMLDVPDPISIFIDRAGHVSVL